MLTQLEPVSFQGFTDLCLEFPDFNLVDLFFEIRPNFRNGFLELAEGKKRRRKLGEQFRGGVDGLDIQ